MKGRVILAIFFLDDATFCKKRFPLDTIIRLHSWKSYKRNMNQQCMKCLMTTPLKSTWLHGQMKYTVKWNGLCDDSKISGMFKAVVIFNRRAPVAQHLHMIQVESFLEEQW